MSTQASLQSSAGIARISFSSENGIQTLGADVRTELKEILGRLHRDKACRVVIFEATGRSFIAGADLQELKMLTRKTAREFARAGQRLFQRIADLPAVTIAAIHAACVGGGCELALACDVRLAAASARIGLPEVTLGLIPGWGGTARTETQLGSAIARRVVFSGQLFPAADAQRLGLVDEVLPDDQFRDAVSERAAQYLKAGPAAVATVKQVLSGVTRSALARLLQAEAKAFAECFRTEEPVEGLAAFLEKRPARWAAEQP